MFSNLIIFLGYLEKYLNKSSKYFGGEIIHQVKVLTVISDDKIKSLKPIKWTERTDSLHLLSDIFSCAMACTCVYTHIINKQMT